MDESAEEGLDVQVQAGEEAEEEEAGPPVLVYGEAVGLGLMGVVLCGGLGPLLAAPLADLERFRLRLVDLETKGGPLRRAGPWWRTRYTDPASWRELGYVVLLTILSFAAERRTFTMALRTRLAF